MQRRRRPRRHPGASEARGKWAKEEGRLLRERLKAKKLKGL